VRAQLHELHERLHFTAVFVTHDQNEALALGDRLAIMRQGKIEQFDTPEHVFEEPATDYVAGFIGMSNRFDLDCRGGQWSLNGQAVTVDRNLPLPRDATSVGVRVRPDDLALAPSGTQVEADSATFPADVVDAEFGGRHIDVVISVSDTRLHARVPSARFDGWARRLAAGDKVLASFPISTALFFDESGARVAGHVSVVSPVAVGA
jgi:iron(III) transport system ATP-binding protein